MKPFFLTVVSAATVATESFSVCDVLPAVAADAEKRAVSANDANNFFIVPACVKMRKGLSIDKFYVVNP